MHYDTPCPGVSQAQGTEPASRHHSDSEGQRMTRTQNLALSGLVPFSLLSWCPLSETSLIPCQALLVLCPDARLTLWLWPFCSARGCSACLWHNLAPSTTCPCNCAQKIPGWVHSWVGNTAKTNHSFQNWNWFWEAGLKNVIGSLTICIYVCFYCISHHRQ